MQILPPTRRASYEWYRWLYEFCHRRPPRPTESELRRALEKLTPSEQLELLGLMEAQAQKPPPEPLIDDRPSFDELLAELRDEYAAENADTSAFREAWDRHEEATRQHFERLEAENPPPLRDNPLVSDPVSAWFLATIEKAHSLAEADG